MSRSIDEARRAEILKDALALPTEARAALTESLLESLGTEVDEDAEAAWATEVNRRIAELGSGAAKTVSLGRSAPPPRGALMPRSAVEVHRWPPTKIEVPAAGHSG